MLDPGLPGSALNTSKAGLLTGKNNGQYGSAHIPSGKLT